MTLRLLLISALLLGIHVDGLSTNPVRFNHLSQATDNTTVQIIRDIAQDSKGFIWIVTAHQGLFKYDGYKLTPVSIFNDSKRLLINSLVIDDRDVLWIGTEQNGLVRYDGGDISVFRSVSTADAQISSDHVQALFVDEADLLWVATDIGIDRVDLASQNIQQVASFKESIDVKDLYMINKRLLIGSTIGLFELDPNIQAIIRSEVPTEMNNVAINAFHVDEKQQLWMGTNRGLFVKKSYSSNIKAFEPQIISGRVFAIESEGDTLWVGTLFDGLYKVHKDSLDIENFRYAATIVDGISDNSILSLMVDDMGILWVGTFNDGINYIDSKTSHFGLQNDSPASLYCSQTKVFYHFYQNPSGLLWVASEKGLIKFHQLQKSCELIGLTGNESSSFSHELIYHVIPDGDFGLWVSTARGLNHLTTQTGKINQLLGAVPATNTFFTVQESPTSLLLGTNQGLYRYYPSSLYSEPVSELYPPASPLNLYHYAITANKQYIFATDQGVYQLNGAGQLAPHAAIQSQLPATEIMSLHVDEQGHIWVGTFLFGLYQFNQAGHLLTVYGQDHGMSKDMSINSILSDDNDHLWLGTDKGLVRLNKSQKNAHVFRRSDGLQSDTFIKISAYKSDTGQLYFGGRGGFNAFDPDTIEFNHSPPNIVITQFNHFGEQIEPHDDSQQFSLAKPINEMDSLVLTHKDYVIGFEFAALDYADPSRNQYAYTMAGLDPDWIYTSANDRRVNYTNLAPGKYIFKVKGANKDGVWSSQPKSIEILVLSPPWLRWWAISAYVAVIFGLISWYFRKKQRRNVMMTQLLREEVAKRTEELQLQKKKVENLLFKKNEFFTHMSHEFRTPLTLILGPINQLLNQSLQASDMQSLQMVKRNANRLLTMIEQLLQMAKVSDEEKIEFKVVQVQQKLSSMVDSFQCLVTDKKIKLELIANPEVSIETTDDALDTVIGNLISNAIKYTPDGGQVSINSFVDGQRLCIQVSDSGVGLSHQQQQDIFQRFKRLEMHQNIEGTGMGLAIVKEVMRMNQGEIEISSVVGQGSQFSVYFKLADTTVINEQGQAVHPLVKQLSTDLQAERLIEHTAGDQQNETVLIIDDSQDMRKLLGDILKNQYHCVFAEQGKTGIALALKHVPDVIICDVMMPEMDGFQVSRILRSDTRTSHIPLILLTALTDQENRIKGWREHVDAYLTKPFDEQELLLQMSSVLAVRNILKSKASQMISSNRQDHTFALPEKDQKFIDKLIDLIEQNHENVNYLRSHMAHDMAVSERQLQRKLKALTGKNPGDLIREYRLKKAGQLLKDGYQVAQIADQCGFSSPAYFSKCFKAQFGMAPKHYQDLCMKG